MFVEDFESIDKFADAVRTDLGLHVTDCLGRL